MNANELADELDNMLKAIGLTDNRVPAMLRQQQAEIEALKANRKHDFGLGEASGFIKGHKENPYKAITNTKIEPTVVSYTHPVKEQDESFDRTASHMAGEYVSYPVKEQDTDCQYCKQGCIRCDARKQLTDAEIRTIQDMCHLKNVGYNTFIMRFARAILRKAQEK